MQLFERRPFFRLGFLQEGDQNRRVEAALGVEVGGVGLGLAALREQARFDGVLEGDFAVVYGHGKLTSSRLA